jgi:hypothetical protein
MAEEDDAGGGCRGVGKASGGGRVGLGRQIHGQRKKVRPSFRLHFILFRSRDDQLSDSFWSASMFIEGHTV